MKPHTAPERALKTITHFHKEIGGSLTVTAEDFIRVVSFAIHFFAGEDDYTVIEKTRQGLLHVHPAPVGTQSLQIDEIQLAQWSTLFSEGQFNQTKMTRGVLLHKKYRAWMVIPVTVKKNLFVAIVIARQGSNLSTHEIETAKQLGILFSSILKNIRSRNKKASVIVDETRHRFLLRTQSNFERKQTDIPGFAQVIDYSACIGSDMGRVYQNNENNLIACLLDITANDTDRQTGLVYLDTWFSILAQTTLEITAMLQRLNGDLLRRISESYASTAMLRYSRSKARVEIAGSGSTTVFFFSHEKMEVSTITFGPAAGINKTMTVTTNTVPANPGDIFCLCTDGVTDARKNNGELFGMDAVSDLVRKNYYLTAPDLAAKILATLQETCKSGVNTDDRTLQVLKID